MTQQTGISRRLVTTWLAAAGASSVTSVPGWAQERYPSRTIKIVVPWAPGAVTDITARLIGKHLQAELGQSTVIENKAGASGTVGHAAVAQSPPDGYTLLIGTNSTYAIAPNIQDLPYDNEKAFAPIGLVLHSPQMLCVHPSIPVKTVQELLDYARARQPDGVSFGSAGLGSTSHLAAELLMAMAQTRMLHVPYRGGGPAAQGLIGGEVNVGFVDAIIAISNAQSGLLRMLGASTTERLKLVPDVPAIAETLPGFQSTTDVAMFAPAGTPEPIVRRLHAAMTSALKSPEVAEPLLAQGVILVGGSPQEFPRYLAEEASKWRNLIRTQNLKLR